MIAQHVSVIGSNHGIRKSSPVRSQPWQSSRGVTIGCDVWIGAGAIILPGAEVEEGAIVGAGAVVTGKVPSYAVVAGVPARVIGERTG